MAHIAHRHIADDSVGHVLHVAGHGLTPREGGAAGALAVLNKGVLDHTELGLEAPLAVGVQERSAPAQTIQANGALFHHQFFDIGPVAVPVEALHAGTGGEDDLRSGEGGGIRGGVVRLGALETAQFHLAASEWQGLAAGLDLRGWGLGHALIVLSELFRFQEKWDEIPLIAFSAE